MIDEVVNRASLISTPNMIQLLFMNGNNNKLQKLDLQKFGKQLGLTKFDTVNTLIYFLHCLREYEYFSRANCHCSPNFVEEKTIDKMEIVNWKKKYLQQKFWNLTNKMALVKSTGDKKQEFVLKTQLDKVFNEILETKQLVIRNTICAICKRKQILDLNKSTRFMTCNCNVCRNCAKKYVIKRMNHCPVCRKKNSLIIDRICNPSS